eukprot:Rhum_TRINITY_DN2689_c0_g2::Rhum_TRINITY_DN2689_c0_g2_i1::g.7960::m.7960
MVTTYWALCALCACAAADVALPEEPAYGKLAGQPTKLGDECIVMHTEMGNITLGFYVDAAPATSAHMLRCFREGLFDTNNVFRVDKGFVAQVADAYNGRREKMTANQDALASKKVKGEFSKELKHKRGVLSMGRWDDPNSATHSFSMLLGDAPHLDNVYAIFGEVLSGHEVLTQMEKVETKTEGIFVMPKKRIEVVSTEIYSRTERKKAAEKAAKSRVVVSASAAPVVDAAAAAPNHGLFLFVFFAIVAISLLAVQRRGRERRDAPETRDSPSLKHASLVSRKSAAVESNV